VNLTYKDAGEEVKGFREPKLCKNYSNEWREEKSNPKILGAKQVSRLTSSYQREAED